MEDPRLTAPAVMNRRRNEILQEKQRIEQQGLYIDPTPSESEWNSDEEDNFSYSRASDISYASTAATFTPGILRDVPAEQRGSVLLPEPWDITPLATRTRGARNRNELVRTELTGKALMWLNSINGVSEIPRTLASSSSFADGASVAPSPAAAGTATSWFGSSSQFALARKSLSCS